jgi:hypothetical protein
VLSDPKRDFFLGFSEKNRKVKKISSSVSPEHYRSRKTHNTAKGG